MNSVHLCREREGEREREREMYRQRDGDRKRKRERRISFLILFDIYSCTVDVLDNAYNCEGGEYINVA